MRAFARAKNDSREKERERESGWTWAQVREHRKGVAVRVPLNEERKRYGNRGLGPRGGTSRSSQTAKHVPASSRTSIAREAAHISLSLSLSLPAPLCFSVSSSSFFFRFFLSTLNTSREFHSSCAREGGEKKKKRKSQRTRQVLVHQIHPGAGHRKSSSLLGRTTRCSCNARSTTGSNHADRRVAAKGEWTISSSSFVDEI